MTFDVTLDPEAEEIIILIDNHRILKANKGLSGKDIKLCKNFRALEEEEEKLFKAIRTFASNLLELE